MRRARETLRAGGERDLSLRQLARDAGVSHGAPRRHFPERQDLMDALAAVGFDELTDRVMDRAGESHGDPSETFLAVARTYVDFAVEDAALMDLMFSTKNREGAGEVSAAADRFFASVGSVLGPVLSAPAPAVPEQQLRLLLVATLHGVASLIGSGRFEAGQVDGLLRDAAIVFGARPAEGNPE